MRGVNRALIVCCLLTAGLFRPSGALPAERTTDPDLKTPVQITGRVINESDGLPAAGADVFVLLPAPEGGRTYYWPLPLKQIKADANGKFAYETSHSGRHVVWANHGKLTSRQKTIGGEKVLVNADGTSSDAVLLRLRPAVSVRAMVSDEANGRPVQNATVHLGWSDLADFQTDANGLANVEPLTSERWFFEVWAQGYAKQVRWLNLEAGHDGELPIALAPGATVEGVVRDPDGKPLAGVEVGASVAGKRDLNWHYQLSDDQGRYRIGNLPLNETITLSVAKDKFVRDRLEIPVSEPTTGFDFTMTRRPHGGAVKGIVIDRDGRPVRGAVLTNRGNHSADERRAVSDAAGRFLLDDLFHGFSGCQLAISAKGLAPTVLDVTPGKADAPAELKVALQPGHRISGKVTGENGTPLSDVYVSWNQNGILLVGATQTNEEGGFELDSLPDGCLLSFSKQGYSALRDASLPLDGEGVVKVTLSPQGVIRGNVVDARTGAAVRSFRVSLNFSPHQLAGDVRGTILTDLVDPGQQYQSDEGLFEVNGLLLRMPLQVSVDAEGYERCVNERVECRAPDESRTIEFRMVAEDPAKFVSYRGKLLDAHGEPIAGAQLRLIVATTRDSRDRDRFPFNWTMIENGQLARQSGVRRFLQAATGEDGTFHFERVPGDFDTELVWWGKDIAPGRRPGLETLGQPERDAIEIVLEPSAHIIGKIDRAAFPDATRVSLRPVSRGVMDSKTATLKQGQETFEFSGLPAGAYTINLMGPAKSVGSRGGVRFEPLGTVKVDLEPGDVKRVEFVQKAAAGASNDTARGRN